MYLVGGAVRDHLRLPASSDTESEKDYVVCGMEFEELMHKLASLGKCDFVGKSFGVIKFTPETDCSFLDWHFSRGISCDIALPRRERSTGIHHRDFDVTFDPFLPLEQDLMRRDFTINAMAMTSEGEIIDPADGMRDLKKKVIKLVFPYSFQEDPLRVLRAAQFAARFDFDLDTELVKSTNEVSLAEISSERIRNELQKGIVLPARASLFFRHLAHMKKLDEAFPELGGINAYWNVLYSVLDRCPGANRFMILYWFLDRTPDELDAYVKNAIDRQLSVWEHDVLAQPALSSNENNRQQPVYQVSPAYGLFTRLRFSNREIANSNAFSAYSIRIPETADRKSKCSIQQIVRWTLKAVQDEGLDMHVFLETTEALYPDIYEKVRSNWERGLSDVELFLDNPPISGNRLLELGFTQGIIIGEILNAVSEAHNTGKVINSTDAEMFVLDTFGHKRNIN